MQKRALIPTAAQAIKALTVQTAEYSATMLMYGYIGRYWDYDGEQGVTAAQFKAQLDDLAKTYPTIHLRINSLGGSVFEGNAMMTAIRECAAEVHTWNDGHACSMAADIWMCGHRRHMAANALLMIHAASTSAWGTAADLRSAADYCDAATESAITATSAAVGMTADEMREKYYTGGDTWLAYSTALADGLVTEPDETYLAVDPPSDPQKLGYARAMKEYQALTVQPEQEPTWLEKLTAALKLSNTPPAQPEVPILLKKTKNVTIQELTDALSDGTLNLGEVEAAVSAHKLATAPPANPLADKVAELSQKLADMTAAFEALKAAPGAARSTPPAPTEATGGQDPLPEHPDVEAFGRKLAEAQQLGRNPFER